MRKEILSDSNGPGVPVNIIVVGLFSVKVTEPLFAVGGWFTWVTMTDTETASDV